jgi:hypothetical protein
MPVIAFVLEGKDRKRAAEIFLMDRPTLRGREFIDTGSFESQYRSLHCKSDQSQ